jgi:hypothetical protein
VLSGMKCQSVPSVLPLCYFICYPWHLQRDHHLAQLAPILWDIPHHPPLDLRMRPEYRSRTRPPNLPATQNVSYQHPERVAQGVSKRVIHAPDMVLCVRNSPLAAPKSCIAAIRSTRCRSRHACFADSDAERFFLPL